MIIIIDVVILEDGRVGEKEDEKVESIKILQEPFEKCGV